LCGGRGPRVVQSTIARKVFPPPRDAIEDNQFEAEARQGSYPPERLAQGLRQLMAGSRKFAPEYLTRDDLAALTPEAAAISGIRYVMEVDQEQVEEIFTAYR